MINKSKINKQKLNKSKLNKSKLNKNKLNKSKFNKHKINKYKINKSSPNRSNIIKPMYGGMMCEDITKKYVSYLIHGTSLESFEKILEYQFIKANIGDKARDINGEAQQLNKGAFMQLIFDCNKTKIIKVSNKLINLVMSNELLSDYNDYHINNDWFGGMKFKPLGTVDKGKNKSYNKEQFRLFLEENEDKICRDVFSKNEIIFNNDIPLTYLKEIWICDVPKFRIQKSTKSNNNKYEFQRTITDVELTPLQKQEIIKKIKDLLESKGFANIPVKLIDNLPKPIDNNYCETYNSKTV